MEGILDGEEARFPLALFLFRQFLGTQKRSRLTDANDIFLVVKFLQVETQEVEKYLASRTLIGPELRPKTT